MTRWARANNIHKHKPTGATPWSQLRAGGRGGGRGGAAQRDPLRKTQAGGSAVKKPNRKKKEYMDEDVNGFMEYLQQSGQTLPAAAGGAREGEQELREEVQTALTKDKRREDRRLKRQKNKKNNMVSRHDANQISIYINNEQQYQCLFVSPEFTCLSSDSYL